MRLFKPQRQRWTRLFFATDIHGSTDCFLKFLGAAAKYEADVIIMGGDITGKMLVPIVREQDGRWSCEFLGVRRTYGSEEELAELEVGITRSGLYPHRFEAAEFAEIGGDPLRVEEVTHEAVRARVREWVEFADGKFQGSGTRVIIGAGNDDYFDIDPILDASRVMTNHNERIVELDEHHALLGLGYANETPWQCPRDVPEDVLADKIAALVAQAGDVSNAVFCFHVPPKDSQLDTCPELDTSTDPPSLVMSGGGPKMFGAGSRAVRDAIERHQPLLGLHGHIHESRAVTTLRRTVAINPGSEYSEGVLRGAIVNLAADEVVSYQFTSG
jgi:Icc-related predicted phosphoesterase